MGTCSTPVLLLGFVTWIVCVRFLSIWLGCLKKWALRKGFLSMMQDCDRITYFKLTYFSLCMLCAFKYYYKYVHVNQMYHINCMCINGAVSACRAATSLWFL